MDINCTLFVQAFHFLVAYLLLRWLLFKPAFLIIEDENNQKKVLHDTIQGLELEVDAMFKKQQLRWQNFHHSIATTVPAPDQKESRYFSGISAEVAQQQLSDAERDSLIDACVTAVVKEVNHVRV